MPDAAEAPAEVRELGPYRVLDRLSAGGMGVVYRARHVETGAAVALKTVRVPEVNLLHSIRREIHALRRLQHPGVVRVLAEGVEGGLPWYAMELLEGSTLRRRLAAWWPEAPPQPGRAVTTWQPGRGTPTRAEPIGQGTSRATGKPVRRAGGPCASGALREVLTLVRRLCDVLAFIHGEGIVHRDLKPENIVLRPDGAPVLVDFGLVTAFGGSGGRESLEVAGSFEGSVEYVSPEQVDGKLVDARADLYALGCILYELVTGQPPFQGTGWEVLLKQLSLAPLPPSGLAEGIPRGLEDLILRLLAKAPRERIGYASDVAAALAELGAEHEPPSTPPARPYLYRPEFAGRTELLEELERRLDRARTGKGSCVLVAGDSGTGKTRLAMELATSANRRSFRVVTGECLPLEGVPERTGARGAPLHPFKPLLQAISDYCRTHGPEVTGSVLGDRGRLLAFYEPSLALLSGQEELPEPARLSGQAAHDRLLAAFGETLAAFIGTSGEPLLLVLDDLQWADALSLDVLAHLQKNLLRRARVLVMGTWRTDEESEALRALSRRPGVTQVRLGALDQATVAAMVRDMLALPSPPEPFIRFLTAQSEGNPFFLGEYLRAAIDEGLLRRNDEGRWYLLIGGHEEQLHEALPLPGSLRELVGRRLSGLSMGARFLVEVGSVLGREFEGELLAKVACLPDEEALEGLKELLRRNVVEEVLPGRFHFVHDKLREVACEALPAERRRLLHQSVAEALEARYRGSAGFEQLSPVLAHHWELAGAPEQALEYLELAGERSLRAGANAEAADFFRRALALDARRGGGQAGAPRRSGWERLLGEALYGTGDVAGSREHLLRALAALGWPMPAARSGWLKLLLAQIARQLLHLALPARGVQAREGERERLASLALAAARLSECYYFHQEMLPTVAASVLAVNLAERAGRGGEIRRIYSHLGYLVGLGKLHPLARRYFARAQGDRQALEDPAPVAYGGILEGMYHVTFGRYGRTAEKAREALRLLSGSSGAREPAVEKLAEGYAPPEIFQAEVLLGSVDFYEGRLEESVRRMTEARELARAQSNAQYEAWAELDMARGLIALDRLDEAVALLEHAQQLLAGKGDRSSELQSHGMLATAYLHQGELERARAVADGVVARLGDVQPAMFSEGVGFEGIAQVYLAAWEREGTKAPEVAKRARYACKVLARFALLFPLARPASLRCLGRAHWLAGHARRARARWRRSLELALRLGMPSDVALAHLELGRHAAAGSLERERHLLEAQQWLSRLGRALPLEPVQEPRSAKLG